MVKEVVHTVGFAFAIDEPCLDQGRGKNARRAPPPRQLLDVAGVAQEVVAVLVRDEPDQLEVPNCDSVGRHRPAMWGEQTREARELPVACQSGPGHLPVLPFVVSLAVLVVVVTFRPVPPRSGRVLPKIQERLPRSSVTTRRGFPEGSERRLAEGAQALDRHGRPRLVAVAWAQPGRG